jgi:hypothetical protein
MVVIPTGISISNDFYAWLKHWMNIIIILLLFMAFSGATINNSKELKKCKKETN